MTVKKHIKTKRVFSECFKKTLVSEYETGKFSVLDLSRLHSISQGVVYRWIYRYSSYQKRNIKVVEMADSSTQKLKELQQRIAELERILGQKQLNIEYLEKLLELAKAQYGIDIKKNSATPPSSGSSPTGAR